jgi:hypothetical protein
LAVSHHSNGAYNHPNPINQRQGYRIIMYDIRVAVRDGNNLEEAYNYQTETERTIQTNGNHEAS